MKTMNKVSLFLLLSFSTSLFAYGGGGSSKSCTKPGFSEFQPPNQAEVSKGADFSFLASKTTSPSSINVTVKKVPADIQVNETPKGLLVTGKLPESLQDTFARISIEAKSNKGCYGNGGWLVKISP